MTENAPTPAKPPIESVDRALQLILLLKEHGCLSIREAADALNVAPSTAHRLLATLVHRDFAVQDFKRRYRPGSVMTATAPRALDDQRISEAGMRILPLLQREVGETVQIMVLRGQNIRFLDGVDPSALLRVAVRRGEEMPAFVSSGGKAMLARLSNAEIEELYPNGLPAWPNRKLNTVRSLKRAMTRIRRDGYAVSVEETEQGVAGVGVAVTDDFGFPIAAITVAVPVTRFDREKVPDAVAALQRAADDIQVELAG